jgi:class 3 adenylate cyclase
VTPRTKYAKSGDILIAYQVTGEGPVDLIVAPGTVSHLDMDWEIPLRAEFFEALGRFCRLIRFDKRGTGLSDRPTQMASLEERSDDIRAVMDAENLERAHLLGISEGGSMVCLFAALHPERVQSVLVWGAQARWIWSQDHPWGQKADVYAKMVTSVREEWASESYIRGVGAGFGPDAEPALIALIARYMRSAASPSAAATYELMNGEIDIRGILGSIRSPTLVMNRTGDPVAQLEAARDLASRIPGAIFKEYPGNSHSIMSGNVSVVLADIQQFITGERPTEASERRLAAILFIDVVDSTGHAVRLGDQSWRTVLESYYRLVRREFARFRGEEMNVAGDGFLAIFDGPARAVRCGHAIASAASQLGLKMRGGVHVGECEILPTSVAGQAVHAAARIVALAGSGEILASMLVRDLVPGAGIDFDDRGSYKLKGVPGRHRLFATRLAA